MAFFLVKLQRSGLTIFPLNCVIERSIMRLSASPAHSASSARALRCGSPAECPSALERTYVDLDSQKP
jgi:hypothetical protein